MTKQFFLFKQVMVWFVVALLCGALSPVAIAQHAQHETHTMPVTSKSQKPKAAVKRNTKRKAKLKRSAKAKTTAKPATGSGRRLSAFETIQRAKPTTSVHVHTPGMVMPPAPATAASNSNSRRARSSRRKAAPPHKHTPGMAMPGSSPPAKPPASTSQHEMHMPQASATPSPEVASPHKHTPGMAMPASSPALPPASTSQHEMHMPQAVATPSASPKPLDTQTPMSHPSPDPASQNHDSMGHPAPGESKPAAAMTGTHGAGGHEMTTGSLLEMSGDAMSIRVGASENNVMPMGQMASGTSWQPASTRMNMLHKASGEWLLMFHYNAIVGVNSQGGPRGVTKFESANWFMPMAFRKAGPGTLELRGMFSLEPFTFPPGGSPLLFQTGETYKGQPIIDAQHPHDLFMELSASYTVPVGDRATWFAYFGYPGEPALGPTAFMHRASASENPAAALSHHLQDSSHISFGVLTTGFTYRWFKLEGSVFNGREPDENRYNFEAHRWNSRSARLSFAPNRNWSMQVSHGLLRDPEANEPGDVRRTTASISYNRPWKRGNWATSLIWGRNHEMHSGEVFKLNGYVAESTINFLDKNYLYTRLELVDKNALLREGDRQLLGITDHHPSFRIGAYTFGGARDVWVTKQLSMAIGGDVTFYSKSATLDPIYGTNPTSYRLFVRFRPNKMDMGSTHAPH